MKKTITVNLGGRAFQITEDAYAKLNDYLSSIAVCFKDHEGGEEITADIESRISELCYERLQVAGNAIIDHALVNDMIRRIGNPENMFSTDDEEKGSVGQEDENAIEAEDESYQGRKFYRNADDKIIAGVISGIASYIEYKRPNLRPDVTLLRILAVVLCMAFPPVTVLLYLILWFIVPVADNTADKLRMAGVEPTPENIASKITDENYKETNSDVKKDDNRTNRIIIMALLVLAVVLFIRETTSSLYFNGMIMVLIIMSPIFYITYNMLNAIKKLSPLMSILMMVLLAVLVFVFTFLSFSIVNKFF